MSEDVFTALVDQHYTGLYRFALSLARNTADACDLTQQTFYIWARKGHSLRDVAKVKTWLFTTLYREFLRGRRRGARETALEDAPEAELSDQDVDQLRRVDAAVAWEALTRVDEVFRAPLTLFYLEELSYQEIATTLNVPIGTVMSRLARGKSQLRAALADRRAAAPVVPFVLPAKKQTP
ncbi:RNA polymerase sigma factor [Horticoccus luteus]|uniref:RNA polymerase sigma factor n=1 Tax=Horticoccus luteus TaxID=2862869 RepID=A0A8F9TZ74_9BACT|nr:RNA polymerase sigma factor [Horticoccus luteus]QYM80584.1 RNA polymerase sigma factor [Horticoccus luteus]